MKKLSFLLIVFILAAGFVFAQEETQTAEAESTEPAKPEPPKTEFFNLEVTIGFPVHWTTGLHDNEFYPYVPVDANGISSKMEDRFASANTAIGFALNFNFSRVVGLVIDFDFFYAAKLNGLSTAESDYIALAGFNAFMGPVFYLFNNNILRIPLAIGFHLYYFNDDVWVPDLSGPNTGAWMNRDELQFGAGAYLGIQFHFSRDLYIFSRTSVSIDLVRMHTVKGYFMRNDDPANPGTVTSVAEYVERSHTDILNLHWNVKPTIGVGIKF